MKKALNLKITLCILCVLYVIILIALFGVFGAEMERFWFPLALVFVGLYLLKKAFLMNSDSSLWLSVLFVSAGFAIVLCLNVNNLKDQLLLSLSICVAVASLIVYLTWNNEAHLYLFITTILGVVPAILFTLKIINFWGFVIFVIVINIINFFISKLFIKLFAKK